MTALGMSGWMEYTYAMKKKHEVISRWGTNALGEVPEGSRNVLLLTCS